MAILVHQCPHCLTERAALNIQASKLNSPGRDNRAIEELFIAVAMFCPICGKPIGALLGPGNRSMMTLAMFDANAPMLVSGERDVLASGALRILELFPKPPAERIPEHLDARVEIALRQAERAYARQDADAAGMMYRRALETTLKITFPAVTGSLFARINALVTDHKLPPAIGEWAHEVREIGNEAAHSEEPLSHAEMVATRNFVDAVLRYVVSFPGMIAQRRADPEAGTPPGE